MVVCDRRRQPTRIVTNIAPVRHLLAVTKEGRFAADNEREPSKESSLSGGSSASHAVGDPHIHVRLLPRGRDLRFSSHQYNLLARSARGILALGSNLDQNSQKPLRPHRITAAGHEVRAASQTMRVGFACRCPPEYRRDPDLQPRP